jgi:predicted phage terminase large subunit-like protein
MKIKQLIEKYGEDKAKQYLQYRFSKLTSEAFWEFARTVYGEKMEDETPEMHRKIIASLIENIKKGKSIGNFHLGRNAFGAPRGGAKSTLLGTLFLSWVALNGFLRHVLYCSDTYKKAMALSSPLRKQIETNKRLQFIYPEAKNAQTWGKEGFVVNGIKGECLVVPIGAGMNVRGASEDNVRPQLAILDDMENLELVYSKERRQKLQDWLDFDLEPAMDRRFKNIIYVGTILHYHSLLKQVLNNEGKYKSWNTRIFKALDEQGKSFWESRFSAEYLKSIKDDPTHPDYVGSIVFAQEYQNEPQDDKDRIIKMDWIKEYNYNETWRKVEGANDEERRKHFLASLEITGGVDTAISEKESADNFSFYTYGFDKVSGKEYMLDLIHGKFPDINEQVKVICDCIQSWGHDTVGIETVAYQQGLYKLVRQELQRRRVYKTQVRAIKTDKDKIRRAKIHSSAFEGGFILLRADHEKCGIIRSEIEEFPLGKNDDAFDSLMLAREARQKPKARVFANKPAGF